MVKSLEDGKTVAVSPSSPSETKKSNNVVQVEASQQDHLNKEKQGKWQDIEANLSEELAYKTEKVASLQQELEKQKLEKQAVMDNKESKATKELNEKNKKISALQEELDKERVGRKDDKNKISELENKLKISNLKENKLNPVVFFDISIGGSRVGRVIMELFADVVPKTAENFRALCTGEKGNGRKGNLKPLHYKGSSFHLAFPQSWIVGGDITAGDGTGGESIYGGNFPLENFVKKHSGPGILSMMTNSSGTNGSQFYIWMKKAEYQDGRDVVFGQVVEGMDVIWAIDKAGSGGVISTKKVVIEDCGQLI